VAKSITLGVLVALAAAGQDEIPVSVLNFARIQHHMADELGRLPNYTCLETIDRYTIARGGKPKPLDRIRINVALVGGKELYSWPGEKSFEDRTLPEMVHSGFLSDGDFAAMTRNVFVNRNAAVTFAGEEELNGRKLLRYDFEISAMRSGWQVRLGGASGTVGAKGWFLADAATYDLVKFRFEAVDLPAFSSEKGLEEVAEYGRVRLGDGDILLPLTVDLKAESFDEQRHWNHATFTSCREYAAQTSISFGEEGSAAPAVTVVPVQAENNAENNVENNAVLPPGVEVALKLDTGIDSVHAAVGDEIRAVVTKNVQIDKEVILRRGAIVKGVIQRFDRHVGNRPYTTVGIEFTEAVFGGKSFVFFGRMDSIARFAGLHRTVIGFDTPADHVSPGTGLFYVEGEAFVIPKGLSLTWITQPVRSR
jgi:hypothetical protein